MPKFEQGGTGRFQSTFFPFCVSKWNDLDPEITKLPSISLFKNKLLPFIRPSPNPIYKCHDPHGITLLTRLRVGFSHLREHKFRHGFTDIYDPFCSCRTNSIETTKHYLLHCPNLYIYRKTLFDSLLQKRFSLLSYNPDHLTEILLFGDSVFSVEDNKFMLIVMPRYVIIATICNT